MGGTSGAGFDDGLYGSTQRSTPEGLEIHASGADPAIAARIQAAVHPVDALKQVGAVMDPDREAEARRYCDEIVDIDGCGIPNPSRKGDWIQTFSGRQFWPLDPRPDEIFIEDIAHHLALLNRYTGASEIPWSVCVHSIGVYEVVTGAVARLWESTPPIFHKQVRRRALVHDGTEAYINDMSRPVKRTVVGYDDIEAGIWRAMCLTFDLGAEDWASVNALIKQADNAMLLAEQAALMKPAPVPWSPVEVPEAMLKAAKQFVRDWQYPEVSWRIAKRVFLRCYEEVAP